MGCVTSSKSNENQQQQPTTALEATGRQEPPGRGGAGANTTLDARLPLNNRDAFKLKSSWKAIHRKIMETGVELFMSLFKRDPDLRQFFARNSKIPAEQDLDDLRENSIFQNHAENVMTIMDDAIVNIEDVEKVTKILNSAASQHAHIPGFLPNFFWKFEEPLLDAVRVVLEDRFSDAIAEIYKKTFHFIIKTIEEEFIKLKE